MANPQYTLIGFSATTDSETPCLLFVHVQSAKSAEDARAQMQKAWPFDATFKTVEGHLEALDDGHALDLCSDGSLSLPPKAVNDMVEHANKPASPPRRMRP